MPHRNKPLNISKNFLIKSYIKNKRSSTDIGKELGCDHKTVLKYLKLYKIPLRGRKIGYKYWTTKGGRKKGSKLTKEHKRKIANSLHIHHIDANRNNNNKSNFLLLTPSKHRKLHSRAYHYLVSIGKIKDYIKWFDKKYSLK